MSHVVRHYCRTELKKQNFFLVVIENVEANLTQRLIRNKDGDPVNLMFNPPRECQGHINSFNLLRQNINMDCRNTTEILL